MAGSCDHIKERSVPWKTGIFSFLSLASQGGLCCVDLYKDHNVFLSSVRSLSVAAAWSHQYFNKCSYTNHTSTKLYLFLQFAVYRLALKGAACVCVCVCVY
jgi:hypothetical protein